MSIVQLSLNFNRLSDTELFQRFRIVVGKSQGHATFGNPPIPVADLSVRNEEFAVIAATAVDGSVADTRVRDQKRQQLIADFRQMAFYVLANGGNDPVLLASSGFEIQTTGKSPIGKLGKPENFKAEAEGKSNVKLSLKKLYGAKIYVYEYTLAPHHEESVWQRIESSRTSTVVAGLQSGKEYAFRVYGVGTDPSRVSSDVINSFVL